MRDGQTDTRGEGRKEGKRIARKGGGKENRETDVEGGERRFIDKW